MISIRIHPAGPLLAGLSLAAFLAGCNQHTAAVQGAAPAEPSVPVAIAKRTDLTSNVTLTGEFEAFQEVDVMAKVAGYIKAINVDIGDRVRAGQVLATLEIPEMGDDLTRAGAAIEQAESQVTAARDDVTRTQSAHQLAHLSSERVQKASQREAGLIPQQDLDEARSRDLVSEAQVSSATSNLRAAEQRVKILKSEEQRVRTMNNYLNIVAPFAGIVTKRYANSGSMIQAGTASQSQAMPVIRLSQNNVLRLVLPVPEAIVSSIRLGASVAVRVNALNRTFTGRVTRFTSKVDQATRTMSTQVDVANPSLVIMPGMYAEVNLQLDHRANVLSVPLDAIDRSDRKVNVYRVAPGNVIAVVPVQLGIETANRVQILSGLEDGDQVIVGRRTGLLAGEKIKPKPISDSE